MAIQYVLHQDNRKNIGTKLYYGRAVHPATVGLKELAERVARQSSLTVGDCQSCITNLVSVMNDVLMESNKCHLEGLGTFFIGLKSVGALAAEDYNSNEHVKGFKVNFLAEGKRNNGIMTRTFTDGLKVVKAVGSVK